MRVLWLTPELPYWPGGSGGSTRQFHLVRRLLARGHAVTVVAPVHHTQQVGAQHLRATGARLLAIERPPSRAREAADAIRRRPGLLADLARRPVLAWQVEVFWTQLRDLAHEALREQPDVALVEHDWAAAWAADLPRELPRVLALENLSWAYYEARARASGGLRALALQAEARRFRAYDRRLLGAYDALLAMSEADRVAVRDVSAVRCELVPNGVDTQGFVPAAPATEPTLLFTGTMSYPPNAEALLWLLRDIWPRVRAARPDARLLVVGRDVPAQARRLADDRVELAGWVPDMAPWFARAAVVLAPLRSGGGTKLKVLDGLASGRPLVATTMGAEGVALEDGRDAVLADGADDFAGAVIELLGDAARRERIGAAGRRLAQEHYDWRAIGDRLEGLLAELAGAGSARVPS